jgi:hypothetical protein
MTVLRQFTVLVSTAAAASALGIAALVGAGTAGASATDDTFMTVLADEGIQAPSTEEAVSTALDVCAMFDEGKDLYDAVSAVSDYTELEMDDSAYFVGASIGTYCPEHEDVIG